MFSLHYHYYFITQVIFKKHDIKWIEPTDKNNIRSRFEVSTTTTRILTNKETYTRVQHRRGRLASKLWCSLTKKLSRSYTNQYLCTRTSRTWNMIRLFPPWMLLQLVTSLSTVNAITASSLIIFNKSSQTSNLKTQWVWKMSHSEEFDKG